MKLSVVVPVRDGGADLRACLQALARSSRAPDEVLVVDDGSRDGSAACARELGATVCSVTDGPRGPARARNLGAARAKGELLVFVDADVEVHPDTLERFEQTFAADVGLAAVFGSYDDAPPAPGTVSRYKNLLHHFVHQHGAGEAETFWAGCGAIRREVFASVGGFSESYRRPSIEDIELGARLRAAGHRIRLVPEILCTHRKRWTLASLLRTDIFARAVPWTRLILRQGRLPARLNTDRKSRWSAALIGLLALAALCTPAALVAGRPGLACLAAAIAVGAAVGAGLLNRRLCRFFLAHGGWRFASAAAALHSLYLFYSSAVFASLLALERLAGGDPTPIADASAVPVRPASRCRKRIAGALVFVVLLATYVGNGDPLPGGDAVPNVHLAANLLARGGLAYTPESHPFLFSWMVVRGGKLGYTRVRSWDERTSGGTVRELRARGELRSPEPIYYLAATKQPGVYVSSYGAATGLFALPFVVAVAPFVSDLPARTTLLWFLAKLAAAFAVAGSAWFLFLVAAEHLRLSSAVLLTLAYGLGTSVWSVSSQTLWQHAPGELFLALGMYCLFRRARRYAPVLAGLAFALAFLCRPTNSMAVLGGFVVLLAQRRALVGYALGVLPVAAAFVAYNLHFFGSPVAFGQVSALASRFSVTEGTALFRHSFAAGLAGVLVSPSRGLFVFSPVFAFSVWGALRVWREQRWLPLRAAAIATFGIWLVTARWGGWWGGWCYGYRLVVDTAILLAFLAIPVVERIRARRLLRGLAVLLVLWSVGVQILGVVAYDVTGWNDRQGFVAVSPKGEPATASFTSEAAVAAYCLKRGCGFAPAHLNVDSGRFRARLWSVRDSQILYYLGHFSESRERRRAAVRQFLLKEG